MHDFQTFSSYNKDLAACISYAFKIQLNRYEPFVNVEAQLNLHCCCV